MKKLLLLLGCVALLCGCTKSNIVTPEGPQDPDMDIKQGIELDWQQIQEEVNEQFVGNEEYPYGQNVELYGEINGEDHSAYIMATVDDDTPMEEAAAYATKMIKAVNDSAAQQDFSYKESGIDYYGGFCEKYNVWIQVMPAGTKDDESTWLVDDVIPAGNQDPVEPNVSGQGTWQDMMLSTVSDDGESQTDSGEE